MGWSLRSSLSIRQRSHLSSQQLDLFCQHSIGRLPCTCLLGRWSGSLWNTFGRRKRLLSSRVEICPANFLWGNPCNDLLIKTFYFWKPQGKLLVEGHDSFFRIPAWIVISKVRQDLIREIHDIEPTSFASQNYATSLCLNQQLWREGFWWTQDPIPGTRHLVNQGIWVQSINGNSNQHPSWPLPKRNGKTCMHDILWGNLTWHLHYQKSRLPSHSELHIPLFHRTSSGTWMPAPMQKICNSARDANSQ